MDAPTRPGRPLLTIRGDPLPYADEMCIFICMRTTLDLDADLLEKAQRATGVTGKTAVIELGLRTLVEQSARRRLAMLAGTIPRAKAPPRRRSSVAGK
jgi:Arc/MetJ family transcription regulator